MAHDCLDKGLLWVDLEPQPSLVVFVAIHGAEYNPARSTNQQYPIARCHLYLASKGPIAPDSLPDELNLTIVRWLHIVGVLDVEDATLVDSTGTEQPVTPAQLGWKREPHHSN